MLMLCITHTLTHIDTHRNLRIYFLWPIRKMIRLFSRKKMLKEESNIKIFQLGDWALSVKRNPFIKQSWMSFVCLGYYNKITQTEWFLNNRNLLPIVLEAGSLRSECQHGHVLVRIYFQVADCWLPVSSQVGKVGRAEEVSLVPFL